MRADREGCAELGPNLRADSSDRNALQQRAHGSALDARRRAVDQVDPKIALKSKANGIAGPPALVIGNDHTVLAVETKGHAFVLIPDEDNADFSANGSSTAAADAQDANISVERKARARAAAREMIDRYLQIGQSTRDCVVAVLPSSHRNGVGVLFHRFFEAQ